MAELNSPETFISWRQHNKTNNTYTPWVNMKWVKYSIKESDMRIKTATFSSPDYIDLSQGRVYNQITCEGHETFRGIVLSVEEDEDTGLWNYQCQDYNRRLNTKTYAIYEDWKVYDIIKQLFNYAGMGNPLQPIGDYLQPDYKDIQSFNPMEKSVTAIYDKVTRGDIIRSLIFDNNVFADFYFPTTLPAIEPYSPDEWLGKGIYITTPELASYNMKFDITNIVTEVLVKSSEALQHGKYYTSKDLLGIDLACFYGQMSTTVDNPVKPKNNIITGGLGISTDTPILVNCDNIYGKSKDQQMLNDIKAGLESKGYTNVKTGMINPNAPNSDISNVADNGVMFHIVGGLCAGTFRDLASSYYQDKLKSRGLRFVFGCLAPPVKDQLDTLSWLPRAHDDNFSPASFTGLTEPGKFLKDNGLNYVYGASGQELAGNFSGGNSKETVAKGEIITVDGSVTVDSDSASNIELEKQEAVKVMTESVRDLLSFTMKIPGGNPVFKELHTNSFLWTELPERFFLLNFGLTAEAMGGVYTRYSGYELNRWYVEAITTTHDNTGLWFDITLNPFASSYSTYTNILKSAQESYIQATTTPNDTGSSTATERTDGLNDCSLSTLLPTNAGGAAHISALQNKAETPLGMGKIGKVDSSYGRAVQGMTPKQAFKHLQKTFYYTYYWDNRYKCASDAYNNLNKLNCAEIARLVKCVMDVVGQDCVIYHVPNHLLNGVKINGRWETIDLCYQCSHPEYNTAGWIK